MAEAQTQIGGDDLQQQSEGPPGGGRGGGSSGRGAGSRTLGLERWVQFGFIALALLAMWLLGHLIEAVWFIFAEPDESLITLTALLVSGVAALIAYRHPQVHRFANEVAAELSMVTWPTRQETWTNTVVVIVTSVIAASILGLFDAAWSTVTDLIYEF